MTDSTTGSERPRPIPRHASASPDVPDGGIAVALPPVAAGTASARRTGGRRLRGTRRFLRTRRGKWTVVSVLAVIALLVAVLSQGFLSPAAPPLADAPAAPAQSNGLDSAAPTPSASPSRGTGRPASAEEIKRELQARAGTLNNPLNRLRSPGIHTVTIRATSSQPLGVTGYLIPTSIDTRNAYGTTKANASGFALTTKAVGPGYLALMFVQAGKSGAPVTCTVTIDGRTTNRESTAGPYGRQVCLG